METDNQKLPKSGGAKEAMKKLKNLRKKDPSDSLVQIIEEVTHKIPPGEKENPAAAKGIEI